MTGQVGHMVPERLNFTLRGGGPLWRGFTRMRVVKPEHRLRGAAIVFVVFGLLPVVLLGLHSFGKTGVLPPLLGDISLYARFLLAVPILLVAESVLDERCTRALNRFVAGKFYETDECADRVQEIARRAEKLRDSTAIEVVLLIISFGGAQLALFGQGVLDGQGKAGPAELYYALVALPMYQLIVWRWLFRWFVWCSVLWRLARLPLRPLAAHPDRTGGLSFVSEPTVAYALFVCASSVVVSATWATHLLAEQGDFASYKKMFALFVVLAMTLGFAPMLLFVPHLDRARFDGVRDYGELANDPSRQFYRRWIIGTEGEISPLGAPDMSSWIDLGTAYGELMRTRLVPFGPRFVIVVFAAAALPMVPLILTQVPFMVLLGRLGKAMLGGLPG
ncbi:MAG: hypothetical protein HOV80_19990 [Polyangiaceae bacterium]|nr:hypothetical protein [Polyangiaceae bacterium]